MSLHVMWLTDLTDYIQRSSNSWDDSSGVDKELARHLAHLFIRDPISLFSEKINQNDAEDTDHFEVCFHYWHAGLGPCQMLNRRSSEIQETALGKCLQAWSCIYRSMPAGVAQSRHAFVGGSVSTWARWQIPVNKRQTNQKSIRNADQALTVRGEQHADRIVCSPSW